MSRDDNIKTLAENISPPNYDEGERIEETKKSIDEGA